MEMHPKIAYLFEGRETQYPRNLETKYPRIFNRIMEAWETSEAPTVFEDLLIDKRGGRQGFPPEVMSEILFLGRVHDRIIEIKTAKEDAGKPKDPWSNESIKRGLEREQIEYNSKGFYHAISLGNERALLLFVQAGISLEMKNPNGWTPVMAAAYLGSEKATAFLLKHPVNVNAKDSQGYTPLHWAVFKGFPGITKLLLAHGADVDAQSDQGSTPLHQATMCGHARIIDVLLAHKAKVNVTDNEGWTALHRAVSDANVELIKQLVAAGADQNIKDHAGMSALDLAKRRNKAPVLTALGVTV